ncbi:MAG: hypothetical protein ACREHC_05580, partial [Candidatus Levyibacteriota bacterium]
MFGEASLPTTITQASFREQDIPPVNALRKRKTRGFFGRATLALGVASTLLLTGCGNTNADTQPLKAPQSSEASVDLDYADDHAKPLDRSSKVSGGDWDPNKPKEGVPLIAGSKVEICATPKAQEKFDHVNFTGQGFDPNDPDAWQILGRTFGPVNKRNCIIVDLKERGTPPGEVKISFDVYRKSAPN